MEITNLELEALFEEHKSLINRTVKKNRPLLTALRLEDEDVAQQLAIEMLSAIKRFDPERSESLAVYIRYSLQYEILHIKRRHRPHGITGIPKGYRVEILYLDKVLPCGHISQLQSDDDISSIEVLELIESLSESEAKVVDMKMKGYSLRRKNHTAALDKVRRRYMEMYNLV